jgi:hypothetical protein
LGKAHVSTCAGWEGEKVAVGDQSAQPDGENEQAWKEHFEEEKEGASKHHLKLPLRSCSREAKRHPVEDESTKLGRRMGNEK